MGNTEHLKSTSAINAQVKKNKIMTHKENIEKINDFIEWNGVRDIENDVLLNEKNQPLKVQKAIKSLNKLKIKNTIMEDKIDELFDEIYNIFEEQDGGYIYLTTEREKRIKQLLKNIK